MKNELAYFFKDLLDEGAWDMPDGNFRNIVKFKTDDDPEILIPENDYYKELIKIGIVLLSNNYISDRKKSELYDRLNELKSIINNDDTIDFKKANYTAPYFKVDKSIVPDDNGLIDLSSDPFWLNQLTSPEHWTKICESIEISLINRMKLDEDEDIHDMKQVSEWLSKKIAVAVSKYFKNVISPKSSNLPDLIIDTNLECEIKTNKPNLKSEIKVAKANGNNVGWRGGELSKRSGSYIFFSWTIENGEIKFFVCYAYITREDWEKRQKKDYYGPIITVDELFNEYNPYVIVGERIVTKSGMNRIKLY